MAQYRTGRYAEAQGTLVQADFLHRATSASILGACQFPQDVVTLCRVQPLRQAVPANLAFRAMTHHQLGHKELAQAALARLRTLAEDPESLMNAEARLFVREAEARLQAAPAAKK
jgi:hypothetical protein